MHDLELEPIMANYKEVIIDEMEYHDEDESDIESIEHATGTYGGDVTQADSLDTFDADKNMGYGGETCRPVRIYTSDRIYLMRHYDGSQGVFSVPRSPGSGEGVRQYGG